jgi:hypothetical protein
MKRPYPELPDQLKGYATSSEWKADALDVAKNGAFAGTQVMTMKTKLAQTRTDSIIAQLRTVEAIRLYAAANDGKPPRKLEDTGVPVPIDPFSGKPFDYHVEDDGKLAVFRITPPLGLEKAVPYNLRWQVSVQAK